MRFFIKFMAAFAIFTSAATAPALAEDFAGGKMKKIMPYFEKFVAIPESERNLVRLAYRIKSRSQPESEIKAWYELNGETTYLKLNKYGELMELPSLSDFKKNPMVQTNVPEKDAVLAMRARPNIPMTTSYDTPTLLASLDQTDKVGKRLAGFLMGLMRPTAKGYDFEVLTGTTGQVVGKDGSITPLTIEYINPLVSHVEVRKDVLQNASRVEFSAPPEIIRYVE